MPANINIDPSIALGIKQQDPMTNIGNMLNTAGALQQFQQAQQVNPLLLERQQQLAEQGRYTTQKAAQENQERIATQRFISNPENWQTDGRIDIDKINSALPQIAPLTADATISKLTTLGEAQTKGIKAKQNLTTEQLALIASPLEILGHLNEQDPKKYIKTLEILKKQNPDNKDFHKLIDSQIQIIETTVKDRKPTDPPINYAEEAIKSAQGLLTPSQQQTTLTPSAELQDVGGKIQEVIKTPSVAGRRPAIGVTGQEFGKTLPPQVAISESGAPMIVGGGQNRNVNVVGTPPVTTPQPVNAPNQQTAPSSIAPTNQQRQRTNQPVTTPAAEGIQTSFSNKGGLERGQDEPYQAYKERATRLSKLPSLANESMSLANRESVPNMELVNDKILKLLSKKDLEIGPIASAIASKTGGVGLTSDQQEIQKYLEQRIRQESSRSNQDQSSQRSAYGSFGTSKQALHDIIYNDKGILASQRLYNQGILKAQGNPNKPNLAAINEFENKFNQLNNDPNIPHLLGVIGNKSIEQLSKEDIRHLKENFGKMSNQELKDLFDKKQKLQDLVNGVR